MKTKVLLGALTSLALAVPGLTDAAQTQTAPSLQAGRYGFAVAWADLDGDGRREQVIGAPYLSRKADLGGVWISAAGKANKTLPSGPLTGGDNFGFSVANLGDVDGDRKEDLAVGAIHGSGAEGNLAGTVAVYLTSRSTPILLSGEGPMDKFGYTLAAGDLNGDGHPDIVVGAPFHCPSAALTNQGAAYVFFGPEFQLSLPLRALSTATGGLGWSIGVGDIDGDGVDDLLLGATGAVFAFYGGAAFTPDLANPDVIFRSGAGGFGRALAVVGDIDGDGYADVGIGAPAATVSGNNNAGTAYLLKGGSGTRRVSVDQSPGDLLARWTGTSPFERLGACLAGLGDLDGDGMPELAFGAPGADTAAGRLAGRVRVFRGSDVRQGRLAPALTFDGDVKDAWFGSAIAPREDGMLLVGASRARADAGAAYVFDVAAGLGAGANGGRR